MHSTHANIETKSKKINWPVYLKNNPNNKTLNKKLSNKKTITLLSKFVSHFKLKVVLLIRNRGIYKFYKFSWNVFDYWGNCTTWIFTMHFCSHPGIYIAKKNTHR